MTIKRNAFLQDIKNSCKDNTKFTYERSILLSDGDYETNYDLKSIMVHNGASAHRGHYHVYLNKGNYWYNANDNVVQLVAEEDSLGKKEDAYMLIYERCDNERDSESHDDLREAIIESLSSITEKDTILAIDMGENNDDIRVNLAKNFSAVSTTQKKYSDEGIKLSEDEPTKETNKDIKTTVHENENYTSPEKDERFEQETDNVPEDDSNEDELTNETNEDTKTLVDENKNYTRLEKDESSEKESDSVSEDDSRVIDSTVKTNHAVYQKISKTVNPKEPEATTNYPRTVYDSQSQALDRCETTNTIDNMNDDISQATHALQEHIKAVIPPEKEGRFVNNSDLFDDSDLPINQSLFIDGGNIHGTMEELKTRTINGNILMHVVSKYAFDNFGITQLKNSGGKKEKTLQKRHYHSEELYIGDKPISFTFIEVSKNSNNYKYIPELGKGITDKGECIGAKKINNFIILNDKLWQSQFKEILSSDPLDAAAKMKQNGVVTRLFKSYFLSKPGFRMKNDSKMSKVRIAYAYIFYLRETLVSSRTGEYSRLPIWLKKFLLANVDKKITVIMQCDEENRFLRLYIGFPMALHVGKLTLPFLVCDGHHFKTASYTGIMFGICSKDGYGNSALLSFSIIPIENIRHLGWTVECNIRHGLSFKFPLLTDQGKMLNAANAFQNDKNIKSHPYRKEVALWIHICTQHFGRSLNVFVELKDKEELIFQTTKTMSRSPDQGAHFKILRETCFNFARSLPESAFPSIADFAVKILRPHPRHWTFFANTQKFDNKQYQIEREQLINQILTWKTACLEPMPHKWSNSKQNKYDLDQHILECYHMVCQMPDKHVFSDILPIENPHPTCFEMTTNSMEGIANRNSHSGIRNCSPPKAVPKIIELYIKQMKNLKKNMTQMRRGKTQHITGIGQNIMHRLAQGSVPDKIVSYKTVELTASDREKYALEDSQNNIKKICFELSAGANDNDRECWSLDVVYPFKNGPRVRFSCDNHLLFTSQLRVPCPCLNLIYKESKTGKFPSIFDDDPNNRNHTVTDEILAHLIEPSLCVTKEQIKLIEECSITNVQKQGVYQQVECCSLLYCC